MNEIIVTGRKLTLSEATKKRNPHLFTMAVLGSPEPQYREVQTLAGSLSQQTECQESPRTCRITIVRYGKRRLDSDNWIASAKCLRDAIAQLLRTDDAD